MKLGVTDNGSGMTNEVKRRAFDMFFTTKPRGLGTGLGLAMVRKAIDRAGGSVQIHSEQGTGTTVEMIIPVAHDDRSIRESPTAAVCISDGRAASFIRNLLEASGIATIDSTDLHSAAICIMDPTAATISDVRSWQAARADGRLVLFGRPAPSHASAWRSLRPIIIDDPNDLQSVRNALSLAMSAP